MRERLHYSEAPRTLSPCTYIQRHDVKPTGVWYSDHEWREWCEGEEFGLARLKHVTRLELDMSRILLLQSPYDMDQFQKEYEGPWLESTIMMAINWPVVAERYAGIEIAPYQYNHRMSTFWYYGWDCASGCVWDLSAVCHA